MKKKLYYVVHTHAHGRDVYHFKSKFDLLLIPYDDEELVKILGIDFNPKYDETLDIHTVNYVTDIDENTLETYE